MEDQTSWKTHSFTVLVFTGIVVLCSIFFILRMLVGRTQGQKLAFRTSASAAAKADAKPIAKEETRPDLTFYDSVKQSSSSALEPSLPLKIEPLAANRRKVVESDKAAAE